MSDYLWDKSGADPETELLENQLSEFRCARQNQTFTDPAIFEEKPPFWRNRFLFALVPAVGALLVGVFWFSLPTGPNEINSSAGLGKTEVEGNEARPIKEPEIVANKPIRQNVRPPRKVARKTKVAKAGVRKSNYKPVRQKGPLTSPTAPPVLTKEEKEAYAQLIKALSITSSKLRMVKEKANGAKIPNGSK